MGVAERKLRHKEETRASVLQAARNIASREGWQSVTIRKIADEIEYTPPIVYEYFQNKDALLLAIVDEGFQFIRQPVIASVLQVSNQGRLYSSKPAVGNRSVHVSGLRTRYTVAEYHFR